MNFVLVHGSYHGGWCWDLIRPELEQRGHKVIAVDLPISQPGLGAAAYADAVIGSMAGIEDPIVVGHSVGGLITPLVAAARPVRKLVFLAAFLPQPRKSVADQRAAEPVDSTVAPQTAEWTDLGNNVWMVGPNTAREIFYSDVAPDLANWATDRLRPQCYDFMTEVTPLSEWPAVECHSILCSDDHAINPEWVRGAARERLGVEALELPGGHSPFLSRPQELCALLDALAQR